MQVWQFTEQPYPAAWEADSRPLRMTLPNEQFDPRWSELLNRVSQRMGARRRARSEHHGQRAPFDTNVHQSLVHSYARHAGSHDQEGKASSR